MVITIPQTKSDQEGNNVYPRNVYANPLNPQLCPVLALAIHCVCPGIRGESNCLPLFDSGSTTSNFSDWLRELFEEVCNEEVETLGLERVEDGIYGTHSFR